MNGPLEYHYHIPWEGLKQATTYIYSGLDTIQYNYSSYEIFTIPNIHISTSSATFI